jgi:regulator of nonsense transcripts 2
VNLGDAQFKTLDSSIKKNTSFIKKLAKLSEDTKENLLKEVKTLNLSKYISEVVHAIAQTTLKNVDFDAAIKVRIKQINYKKFVSSILVDDIHISLVLFCFGVVC